MKKNDYSDVTKEVEELSSLCEASSKIEPALYEKYEVKRGLRDINGDGVVAGLTNISEIRQKKLVDGKLVPAPGKLFYRGYNIEDLIEGFSASEHFGFEETVYLLIFGDLPNRKQLTKFEELLATYRTLPKNFVRDVIMKAPTPDIMNSLTKSILTLCSYDKNALDTSIPNVLRQCLQLVSVFPLLSVYGYQAYNHYCNGDSFFIHSPQSDLSVAENILYMLRPDCAYTELEASVLDTALVLHAEHGGGNNSTFTTHVVSSSGTDTYSAIAAALCSLKGPRHGGANIKVAAMFDDLKKRVKHWDDDEEISRYLEALLSKKAFDKSGLIYGMGHAVYSISDPRAGVFKEFVKKLSAEKGLEKEFMLYSNVERLATEIIAHEKKIYKGVSANVDFYSGFAYNMLGLPIELFTPIFAVARIAGWSAHRIEELISMGKIIRPAYKSICEEREYKSMDKRK